MKADELRKKHSKLALTKVGHNYQNGQLTFFADFKLHPNLEFTARVTIHDVPEIRYGSLSTATLNNFATQLGMAEIFSYWKAAVPEEISIEVDTLDQDQLDFWHDLLIKGMGEFFYVNKIDFTNHNFVRFTNPFKQKSLDEKQAAHRATNTVNGCLVPLGGGKDSLVSLEILKEHYKDQITLFSLNPIEAVKETFKINSDFPIITATREIDERLIKLNHAGYLNGHTPFSSYLAFLTTIVAQVFGIKYVVLSNERSSNEESVIYLDHPVNHQYSKSFELEEKFRKYAKTYLPQPGAEYFSLLRPLYELQIAKLFTNWPKYFSLFKSCNRFQRKNDWCTECSKCLFAFIILYPFLEEETIIEIFGVNMLHNGDLWNIAKELMGYSHQKPLDCVGTHEESLVALYLCYQKEKQYNKTLSNISNLFEKEVLPKENNLAQRAQVILDSWNNQHALPEQFARIIKYVHQETFLDRQ